MNIIHNDCLLELSKLTKNSVQTIYLDPPFNSDRNYRLDANSTVGFDDTWTDEQYSEFIENVIKLCVPILKPDGSLFFHISSEEMFLPFSILQKYFKIVKPIFWKRCRSKNNIKNNLGSSIDIIFWCSQNSKRKFHMVYQPKDEYYEANSFKNKDHRGNFALGHLVCDRTRKGYDYEFTIQGKTFHPDKGWRINKEELENLEKDDRLYIPKKSGSNLYKKIYLHENPGKPSMDLWDDIPSIAQGVEERKYPTAKPVKLIERIIDMTTDEGDLVLDPMAGSGTTGQACKNKNRNCILIDKNKDAIDIMKNRVDL